MMAAASSGPSALQIGRHRDGSLELDVLVQPRAAREEVVGVHEARLKIRLQAPPVDGEANAALVAFLARALGVPRSQVTIVRGQTGRRKTVRLTGVSDEAVRALAEGRR